MSNRDDNERQPQVGSDGLVLCWTCRGSGIGSPAAMNTAFVDIPCDRCNGTGKCDARMRDWTIIGSAMKAARLAARMSLREWATNRGYSVVDASRAERGLIDPLTLTENDKCPSTGATDKLQK